jgi:hypothetical protein
VADGTCVEHHARSSAALSVVTVQFVLSDLAIESVSVDAKNHSGLGLISTRFGKRRLNEPFFEFTHSFIQINLPFDHFSDEGFQLLFHEFILRVGSGLLLLPIPTSRSPTMSFELGRFFIGAAATSAQGRGSRLETLL